MLFFISLQNVYSNITFIQGGNKGCAPFVVKVTHGTSSSNWDFGNGNISNLDTASTVYNTPGTYWIVYNGLDSVKIEVIDKPSCSFTPNNNSSLSGCLPFTFSLKDNSVYPPGVNPLSWKWLYGDLDSSSGNPTTHTILNHEPTAFVKMIVFTDLPSCNFDCEIPNYINCLKTPVAKIQRNDTDFCKPTIIIYPKNISTKTPAQNVNYLWEWNDPAYKSSTNFDVNSITFSNLGNFKVKLTAQNQLGCKSSDSFNLKVLPPIALFTVVDTFCVSDPSKFLVIENYDTSLYKYDLIFDPHYSILRVFNGQVFEFFANTTVQGSYPVTLKVTRKSDTTCFSIYKKDLFVISLNNTYFVPDSLYCLPLSVSLKVNTNNPFIDSTVWRANLTDYLKNTLLDTFSNNTILNLTLNDYKDKDSFYRKSYLKLSTTLELFNKKYGCKSKTNVSKELYPFAAYVISDKTSGCNPSTFKFRVIPNIHHRLKKIKWFVDGIEKPVLDSFTSQTFNTSGKHKIYCIVEDYKSCIDTTNPVYVEIFDSVVYNASMFSISPTNICPQDTLTLINKSSFSQDYSFFRVQNKSYFCKNGDSIKIANWDSVGKIYVQFYSNKSNCFSSYLDSIIVSNNLAKINYKFHCDNRDSLTFTMENYNSTNTYLWNFGDGTVLSNSNPMIGHKYSSRGDYKITLKSSTSNGTCTYYDTTFFSIRKVKSKFNVPSVLCKMSDDKYPLDPRLSEDAQYECQYTYTWFFEGTNVDLRPITIGDSGFFKIPLTNYTLGLIARDVHGCTDTARQLVQTTVANANFDFDRNIYCRLFDSIKLNNTSTSNLPINSYKWYLLLKRNGFISKIDSSDIKNPIFSYSMLRFLQDSFFVSLKITDSLSCASSEIVKKVPIFYDTLYQLRSYTPDSFCVGQNAIIYYNDSNPNKNKFSWSVNNILKPSDSNRIINVQFSNTGVQWIQLIVENKTNGCRDTVRKNILTVPPINIFYTNSADTAHPLCFGASSTLKLIDLNGSTTSNKWFLNDEATPYFISSPTFPLRPGVNKIVGIIQNRFGCSDTIINYDTVIAPRANFEVSNNIICKGDSIGFKLTNKFDIDSIYWDFGDGSNLKTKNVDSFYHQYSNSSPNNDSVLVSLILSAKGGLCPASVSRKILILESVPKIDTSIDSICKGDFLFKNLSSKGDSFIWDFGNGKSSLLKNPTINFDKSGIYKIKLTALRKPIGCPDTSVFNLIVKPSPSIFAKIDTVCLGDSNILIAKDTAIQSKIYISPNLLGKNWVDTFQKFKIDSTQKYKLKAINLFGCSDSLFITAGVIRPFKMDSLDTIVVQGKKVILPIPINNGQYTFKWTPKPIDFPCLDCPFPEVTIMENKIYQLEWRDTFGCFVNKAIFDLKIYPDIGVKVPTAFTPNGDGNNDLVYARGFGIKKLLHFRIFNRWGQLLFYTQDENVGWDGYYKGEIQPVETYFYNVSAESFIPGKILSFEGNFLLLK